MATTQMVAISTNGWLQPVRKAQSDSMGEGSNLKWLRWKFFNLESWSSASMNPVSIKKQQGNMCEIIYTVADNNMYAVITCKTNACCHGKKMVQCN